MSRLAFGHSPAQRRQRQVAQATSQGSQARTDARVEFGREEAVSSKYAVDGERATIADLVTQRGTYGSSQSAHRFAVFRGRIEPIRAAGIHKAVSHGRSQDHHFHRPKDRHEVREYDAMNADRDAFKKRHDTGAVGQIPERLGRRVSVVAGSYPAQPLGTAVDTLARVGRPHRAEAPVKA